MRRSDRATPARFWRSRIMMRPFASPVLPIVLLLGAGAAVAEPWSKAAIEAHEAYEAQRYEEAEQSYESAVLAGDSRPEVVYNLGAARYRAANADSAALDAALKEFQRAASRGDADLRSDALYNAATMRALLGDLEGAIDSYKEVLRQNPADHHARYNLELLKRMMEQQPQQPQQQSAPDESSEGEDQEEQDERDQEPQNRDEQSEDPGEGEEDSESPEEEAPSQPPEEQDATGGHEESRDEPTEAKGISPEEAMRELDKLEEEERKLLRQLLLQRQRRVDVEKDW